MGYNADIDAQAYGLPVTVFVRVRLIGHTETIVNQFKKEIARFDRVLECFVMTGSADYLLRVVVADLNDYKRFVRKELQSTGPSRKPVSIR